MVTPTWRDPAAIALVLAGGVLAGVGWLVGVVLLWTSPAWCTRDKLIGTLVPPGGLAGGVFLALWTPSLVGSATNWAEQLLAGLALVIPFCTAGYLTRQLLQARRALEQAS
jgi:hypothetical protein